VKQDLRVGETSVHARPQRKKNRIAGGRKKYLTSLPGPSEFPHRPSPRTRSRVGEVKPWWKTSIGKTFLPGPYQEDTTRSGHGAIVENKEKKTDSLRGEGKRNCPDAPL